MGFLSSLLSGGDVVKSVGDAVDNLFTSDEERLEQENARYKAEREFNLKERQILADQNIAQTNINIEEAKTGSFFVAGWRPAIGWVGALALFYQFLLYPLLLWLPNVDNPPAPLDYTMLYSLITGMLGIAGMRSFDKLKKTDTKMIKNK